MLFTLFCKASTGEAFEGAPEGLEISIWRPSFSSIKPHGLTHRRNAFYLYSLYYPGARLRRPPSYFAVCVYDGDRVVHFTLVVPKSFRFRFMHPDDLFIGPIWTDPAYRSRGISTAVLRTILGMYESGGKNFWYIADVGNVISERLAGKTGFTNCGLVKKSRFLGFPIYSKGDEA